jgi:ATP-dependent DNA helicase DinG
MAKKVKDKVGISLTTIFSEEDVELLRGFIAEAGGSEVLFAASVIEPGFWGAIRVLARGNADSAPAVLKSLRSGDILLHNHPSGLLLPSEADMEVASVCGSSGIGFAILNNQCTHLYVVVEPYLEKPLAQLDSDEMLGYLSKEGGVASLLENFEERGGQKRLISKITEAFNNGRHAVLEGETGIGKSMAYLIPSIYFAKNNNCRIAISTNTINLQHQLVKKDLPFLTKVLPFDFKFKLLKGRQNYLCIRKLQEALASDGMDLLLEADELQHFNRIAEWANNTADGSLSDLNWVPLDSLWEKLCCDKDSCLNIKCVFYEQCFFYETRRAAGDADLLIVNHHLLFSDLALRANTNEYSQTAVIPYCKAMILDEAHNLEDAATKHFGFRTSSTGFQKLMNKLLIKKGRREQGCLAILNSLLAFGYGTLEQEIRSELLEELTEVIIPLREELGNAGKELFEEIAAFVVNDSEPRLGEYRQRIGEYEAESVSFELIKNKAYRLRDELARLSSKLKRLSRKLSQLLDQADEDTSKFSISLTECGTYANRLDEVSGSLDVLFGSVYNPEDTFVHYFTSNVRRTGVYTSFYSMPIEVAESMIEYCFSKTNCAILVSGTLSTADNFSFIKNRLGLDRQDLVASPIEGRFESPFSYEEQARLLVPMDLPDPTSPTFVDLILEPLLEIILSSNGGALVLCTSYTHLNHLYDGLAGQLYANGLEAYKQGEMERHYLLNLFKDDGNAVLFATDSFWEGVDIPGSALRNLIIVKLPFATPNDPVLEARNDRIKAKGKHPFREYQMPMAALKLKQGFGRLIRTKADKGVVWILDKRIVTKSYGRYFVDSLPKTLCLRGKTRVLVEQARQFYQA